MCTEPEGTRKPGILRWQVKHLQIVSSDCSGTFGLGNG